MKRTTCLALIALCWTVEAAAQPIMDGTRDAFYDAPLSVQNTRTGYGDGPAMRNPDPILTGTGLGQNGGSELDAVYAKVANGRLYVFLAGNVEGNFNKMNVFIDSGAGTGVNQLNGTQLPGGYDRFCCGGFEPPNGNNTTNFGGLQRMNGLKFDAGFTADYALAFTHGGESVGPHGDYNGDTEFNAADYVVWRNNQGKPAATAAQGPTGNPANPTGPMQNLPNTNGTIDQEEYNLWKTNFGSKVRSEFWAVSAHYADLTNGVNGTVGSLGYQLAPRGEPRVLRDPNGGALGDFPYKPFGNPGNTETLISDYTLDGLGQGELIDRDYALGAGGCADDGGDGCLAREFEFALDVDPKEVGGPFPNDSNHRKFNNIVDLQMAFNNSNINGVRGGVSPNFALVSGEDNPADVATGIEFSIPLSAIGNPAGEIRLLAFVGNNGFDYMSNQVSGDGVYPTPTSGDVAGANLDQLFFGATPLGSFVDLPGNQYVTIANPGAGAGSLAGVPEPTSALLLMVGLLFGAAHLRRRS